MMRLVKMILLMAAMMVLVAGCGGGGGGDPVATATVFKLTLSTGIAPAGSLIGGAQGTITLPPGSSVRTEGTTEAVPGELFTASGNAGSSMAGARYSATTGTINYALVNASGFIGGDFATLQIDVKPGVSVTAADFTLSGSKVIDVSGNTMDLTVIVK